MASEILDFGTAKGNFNCIEHEDIKAVFIVKVDDTVHYYCPHCIVGFLNSILPAVEIRKKD